MQACLLCYIGLEDVVIKEVAQKTSLAITHSFPGAVYVTVSSMRDVVTLAYRLQSISSVLIVDYKGPLFEPLSEEDDDAIRQRLSTASDQQFGFLPSVYAPQQESFSFAVRVSGFPKHKENSKLERFFGDCMFHTLSALFPQSTLTVNLKEPDLLFQAHFINGQIHVGLDWLQKPCGKRDYKVMNSYRSLPAPIAAAPAILLSETNPKQILVSAVYTGETCIETALYLLGLSPHFFSQDDFTKRITPLLFDAEQMKAECTGMDAQSFESDNTTDRSLRVYGFDNNPKRIAQAEKNLLLSQVAESCTLEQRERHMLSQSDRRFDAAILDILRSPDEVCAAAENALQEISSSLLAGSHVVLMLRNVTSFELPDSVVDFTKQQVFTAFYGDEPVFVSTWQKQNL
jgi:23S rRNA G2445 N2-methylase RlmL